MSASIRILPAHLVNQIAAGEVVERPFSAVKELVENALDAGATQIDIALEAGGKRRIVVSDNGKGMSRNDIPLSLTRHATSKLPDNDLVHIRHLGFRGEALPSIASVSRLNIISLSDEEEHAWQVHVEDGEIGDPAPAARTSGTTIAVNDLFYATPARLKFLKSDTAEMNAITDIVKRIAMAHPYVGFTLQHNGKTRLSLSAQQQDDMLDAQLPRLGHIMGKDFVENACQITLERDGIHMTGYAALPTYNRGTSGLQYLFVGGRPVRDRLLLGAIKGAYQDFLARDRHPVCVLFFELPPEEVDVNVHPAKSEVRFQDSNKIRSMIISGIRHALQEAGHRASTTTADQALHAMHLEQVPSIHNTNNQPSFQDYQWQPQTRNISASAAHALAQFHSPETTASAIGEHTTPSDYRANQAYTADEQQHSQTAPVTHDYPLGAACAQLHGTYIVAETAGGLVIVDQHAAHERLVYEQMKEAIAQEGMKRQALLIPEVVELEEDATLALSQRVEEFRALGLVIEPFGNGAIVVREIPALLGDTDVKGLIRNLADDISEYGDALSLQEKLEDICGTMACHGSIRAGRKMNDAEMNALLRQMEATPYSGQCNHGRPTYVELKRTDIERLFGRR